MLKSKKCSNCGGALRAAADQNVIKCLYCDSEFFTENPPAPPVYPKGESLF